jgi:type IV pilus assembly protein PilC
MFFFQQLASLVKSGMTIFAALDNLAARTLNRNLAKAAGEMALAAHAGKPVSGVMAAYPAIFPEHISGMVRAGELGGFLEIVLAEIALTYEENIALYRGAWVAKSMAAQALFVLPLAIPLFPIVFRSFDFRTNLRTYALTEAVLLPLTGVLYLGIRWGVQRLQLPGLRRFRDTTSLRMPVFGNLQREVAIAAFVRMLRKLHHAGVAPIAAWEAAANTASNVAIRDKFADAYVLMQSGATLPDAFAATGLFNNWVENVILTGHQSGEVVQSLDQIADFYQNQVQESAGRARRAMLQLGRLTMLIVGGLSVAWMCHSCYQKEFELTSTDGGF